MSKRKASGSVVKASKQLKLDKSVKINGKSKSTMISVSFSVSKPVVSYLNIEELLSTSSWNDILKEEYAKPYFIKLKESLENKYAEGNKTFFPPQDKIFNAFVLTPWDNVKVVIIGQDPYHDDGQAEGLCFSVPKGLKIPSSLMNIYKELANDVKGFSKPSHGHLGHWGRQGVLLLNTVLTVEAHQANSHKKLGWEMFTNAVIQKVSEHKKDVVFFLWGKHAQDKMALIDDGKHHVLIAAHPSGLSASRGFYGCKHFSKCNEILENAGLPPIDWNISN